MNFNLSDIAKVANPVMYFANNAITGGAVNRALSPTQATSTLSGAGAADRERDLAAGRARGKEIFYDDPDMKMMREKREDLAKGYSGQELGAIRQTARGEIAGQRNNYLRNMHSNLARGGVGGARGAAVRGAADQKLLKAGLTRKERWLLIQPTWSELEQTIFKTTSSVKNTALLALSLDTVSLAPLIGPLKPQDRQIKSKTMDLLVGFFEAWGFNK